MQRALLTLALAAALAACSSAPKTGADAAGNQAGSAGQSTVTPVGVGQADGTRGGPQDVARTVFFDFDSCGACAPRCAPGGGRPGALAECQPWHWRGAGRPYRMK